MTRLMLLLHIGGFTFWIGGAFAMMMVSITARKEERSALRTVARIQAAIARSLVGPGAGVTVVTGLILTFRSYGAEAPSMWLMVMQGAGILGGILTAAVTLPAVAKLARIDPLGAHAAHFDNLRKRARISGMIAAMLGLLAMVAGSMLR